MKILKGISIAIGTLLLVLFLIYSIGIIGFSAWLTATAKTEYVTDTVYCTNRRKDKTIALAGTAAVSGIKYVSTFNYKGEKIELKDENIYNRVKINKKYLAKIKVGAYKSGTKWYEIEKIISEK